MVVERPTKRYKLGSLGLVELGKVGYFGIRLAGVDKWFIILAPAPENHWSRVPPILRSTLMLMSPHERQMVSVGGKMTRHLVISSDQTEDPLDSTRDTEFTPYMMGAI